MYSKNIGRGAAVAHNSKNKLNISIDIIAKIKDLT